MQGLAQSSVKLVEPASEERRWLLVFSHETPRLVALPPAGVVTIGRSEECQIAIEEPSVAPMHARITLGTSGILLEDLGSRDGTQLNGVRLSEPTALRSGDLFSVGTIVIAFQGGRRPTGESLVDLPELRRRVDGELERAHRYGRAMTLVVVAVSAGARDAVAAALSGSVRFLDAVAIPSPREVLLLLAETNRDQALLACRRLLAIVRRIDPSVRAGCSTVPEDGGDFERLLGAARAALEGGRGERAEPSIGVRRVVFGPHEVTIGDPAMVQLYGLLERLASSSMSILLGGETGTGKELAASALHFWSSRRDRPFVKLNCAALPETLVESELFGHDKGAFSGADSAKPGLLESASGGTLFLDEVGELPLGAQAKLLRVLDDGRVTPLGSTRERSVDVRVIAATNRSLRDEIAAGRFREDLYFRLSGGTVWLPPLRDRPREIRMLAETFLAGACQRRGRRTPSLAGAVEALEAHPWPGNVRELRNLMELLATTVDGSTIVAEDVISRLARPGAVPPVRPREEASSPTPPAALRPIDEALRDFERSCMQSALEAARGNQTRAAAMISMPLRTWYARAKQYGLSRPR